ncbi:MAG: TetR/AcrR family transcriptional regulator [Erysipelotrichaceae bacterium]
MKKKQDIRVQKTYQALQLAFESCLLEVTFDEISVHALCERANVRRATFYSHFKDKHDFFEWFVHMEMEAFQASIALLDHSVSGEVYILELTMQLIDYMERPRTQIFLQRLMDSHIMSKFMDIVSEHMILVVKEKIESDQAADVQPPASPEFCAVAYMGAITALLRWWLIKQNGENKEGLIRDIYRSFGLSIANYRSHT